MGKIQSSKCWKSPDASVITSGGDDPTLGEAVMDLCQLLDASVDENLEDNCCRDAFEVHHEHQ